MVFFFEAALKIVAMGFLFHQFAYLRDLWNLVDFIIVVLGILEFLSNQVNLKALRILRVMRPLRTLKAIPSMRRLVTTLFKSIPEIMHSSVFLLFMVMLFSIMGLQQFLGVPYYRCRLTEKPVNITHWPKSQEFTRVCNPDGISGYTCPSGLFCGSLEQYGMDLGDDGVQTDESVQYGISMFDNFQQSLLAVVQAVTADLWTKMMYNMSDGYISIFSQFYFCMVVIIGHFYMIQLLLAVMLTNLSMIQAAEAYSDIRHRRREVKKDSKKANRNEKVGTQANKNIGGEEDVQLELEEFNEEIGDGDDDDQLSLFKYSEDSNRVSVQNVNVVNPTGIFDQIKEIKIKMVGGMDANQPMFANDEEIKKSKHPEVDQDDEDVLPSAQAIINIANNKSTPQTQDQKQAKKKAFEDRFKGQLMWAIGAGKSNKKKDDGASNGAMLDDQTQQQNGINGFGVAILSKMLGIQKIQSSHQRDLNKIEKLCIIPELDLRLRLQKKCAEGVSRIERKIDLGVTKKYMMSKKNVYGIENELHMIEHIQKCLKLIFSHEMVRSQALTLQILKKIFENLKLKLAKSQKKNKEMRDWNFMKPELDIHLELSLKIAYNLRELTMSQNVREFFQSRFKRQLVQKNIIENVQRELESNIQDTEIRIRDRTFPFAEWCYEVTENSYIKVCVNAIVFANSITLAMSKYPHDEAYENRLEICNLAFFAFFCVELVLKLVGKGFKFYLRESFNWFDSGVIFLSAVDIILQHTLQADYDSGAITALRVLRLVRVIRLARIFRDFNQMFSAIRNTLKDINNISILLLIFIFTYALLGMEIYSHLVKDAKPNQDQIYPKSNFNNLYEAVLSVFIVLANDGWSKIYLTHQREAKTFGTTIFFLSLLVIGQFILLNLLIAILIENFEQLSVRNDLTNKLQELSQLSLVERVKNYIYFWRPASKIHPMEKVEELLDDEVQEQLRLKDLQNQMKPSLNYFKFNGMLRSTIRKIIETEKFEWIMLVVICISTVQLAVDNPLDNPDSGFKTALATMDYIISLIFTMEAILKIISTGFLMNGSLSYIRNSWNRLDFLIIMITVSQYFIQTKNLTAIKAFRLLKVLRPLRALSKNQGLKISIRALGVAMGGIVNICIMSLIFYFVAGIIAVNYFKGRFYDCQNVFYVNGNVDQTSVRAELARGLDTMWDCINWGGSWKNRDLNFDNIFQGIASLFVLSSAVSWSDIMYRATNIRGLDLIPSSDAESPFSAILFVFIVIIGNFLLLNLFIGVIITSYNRQKELMGKDLMLTEEQNKWVISKMMILQGAPRFRMKLPQNEWRQPFFYISNNYILRYFIFFCIICNTVILSLHWQGQDEQLQHAFEMANSIFAGVFSAEFIVKYIGYGNRYFKDGWNKFDTVIVFLTILGMMLSQYTQFQLGPQTTVIRSFRIARIASLFKQSKSLQTSFQTFIVSFPGMANIGSLILLVILIYSVLGMYLFSEVMLNGSLTVHTNFQTLTSAFVTLISVSTGEDWPKLMEALSRKADLGYDCIENPSYQDYIEHNMQTQGCGDYVYARMYFFSYCLIVPMVLMKLFIVIILQTFKKTQEKENKFMNSQMSDHFREVWSVFDPDATSFIKMAVYPKFLVELGDPLGWDYTFEHNYHKQQEYLAQIELPTYNQGEEYQFMDVFEHLILIMIIRREVINYSIRAKRFELLSTIDQEKLLGNQKTQQQFQIGEQYSPRNNQPQYQKKDSSHSYSQSEIDRQQLYISVQNYRGKPGPLQLQGIIKMSSDNSDNEKSDGNILVGTTRSHLQNNQETEKFLQAGRRTSQIKESLPIELFEPNIVKKNTSNQQSLFKRQKMLMDQSLEPDKNVMEEWFINEEEKEGPPQYIEDELVQKGNYTQKKSQLIGAQIRQRNINDDQMRAQANGRNNTLEPGIIPSFATQLNDMGFESRTEGQSTAAVPMANMEIEEIRRNLMLVEEELSKIDLKDISGGGSQALRSGNNSLNSSLSIEGKTIPHVPQQPVPSQQMNIQEDWMQSGGGAGDMQGDRGPVVVNQRTIGMKQIVMQSHQTEAPEEEDESYEFDC